MKKIITLLIVSALVLTSCTGDQGPPGPPGPPGLDGTNGGIIKASAFEIEVNFNSANNYEHTESYGFTAGVSDVTLVYILWEVDNNTDVWRLCPQTVNFTNGDLVYNFDFTQTDVRFLLEGSIDFNTLDPEWTQKQVFRVVVVPAENIDGLDVNNIDEVMQVNDIYSFDIK